MWFVYSFKTLLSRCQSRCLVGIDVIVEIKCPYTAYKMHPDEAIRERKIKFWNYNKTNNTYEVNKKHQWYYQIQGQMEVTNRNGCIFAVFTGHEFPLKVEYLRRDRKFWNENMEYKLKRFYNECLLPELVDPRHSRHMPIREPNYIMSARLETPKTRKRKRE